MLDELVAGFLVTLVVLAPVLSPVLLVVVLVRRLRAPMPWTDDPTSWFLLLLGTGPLVYWYGMSTGFLVFKDPEDGCTGRGLPDGFVATRTSYLPLSRTCTYTDGSTLELVPGWVNAALALLAVTTAASLGLIIARAGRDREEPPVDGGAPSR